MINTVKLWGILCNTLKVLAVGDGTNPRSGMEQGCDLGWNHCGRGWNPDPTKYQHTCE